MQRFFWKINTLLYKVLGPNISTQLSQTVLGKVVLRTLEREAKGLKIYKGQNGIRLRLAYREAQYMGFFHFGTMNPYETNMLVQRLHPGDTFIDIGAYVDAWHTIVAAKKVGPLGHVYAFEPMPEFFRRAKDNIALNALTNVTLEKMAVSDKNTMRTFYGNNASSSFFRQQATHGKPVHIEKVKVKTTTLDDYIQKGHIRRIAIVKIDAEGAEIEILRGMTKLLQSPHAPDLMIEIDNEYLRSGGTSELELLRFLKRYGYKAYSITARGLERYKTKEEGRELFNVYFTKRRPGRTPLS